MRMFSEFPRFQFGEKIYHGYGHYNKVNYTAISLAVVETGELILYSDNLARKLSAGQATFLYYQKSFMAIAPSTSKTRVIWCESIAPPLTKKAAELINKLPVFIGASSQIRELLEQGYTLEKQGDNSLSYEELRSALGLAVVNTFLYEADTKTAVRPIAREIQRAKEYIDRSFDQPFNISKLSEVAALSPSYLIKKFKCAYGITPTNYLWHIRAKKGAELLEHSALNISTIANQCGFKNAYHFSRIIKNTFGCSPSEYRKRAHLKNTRQI